LWHDTNKRSQYGGAIGPAEMQGPVTTSAARQNVRAVAVLEHMANDEARQLLKKLAAGAPEARRTREAQAALDRLFQR
jgi:hypothetical protein